MRVRPKTTVLTRRPARRAHVVPPRQAPAPPVPDVDTDVRRHREAGGPIDRAEYSCACGLVFEADVSTSVQCPHCSAAQAW